MRRNRIDCFHSTVVIIVVGAADEAFGEILSERANLIGGAFAAGVDCEVNGFILRGKTAKAMIKIQSNVSSREWEHIMKGFKTGGEKHAIYSEKKNQWIKYKTDEKICKYTVDYSLDMIIQLFD